MSGFYSYLWLRENKTPYYAGKGRGRRAFTKDHSVYPPKDKSRIVIFPMDSEALAFESEIALIELFGRKDSGTGCLHNRTNGGEGLIGCSEETRQKMSAAKKGCIPWNKGRAHSEETRQRISEAKAGKVHSEETRRKIGEASIGRIPWIKGKTHSEETRQRLRESHTGKVHSADTRLKISAARKRWLLSEASHRKLSDAVKKAWLTRRGLTHGIPH